MSVHLIHQTGKCPFRTGLHIKQAFPAQRLKAGGIKRRIVHGIENSLLLLRRQVKEDLSSGCSRKDLSHLPDGAATLKELERYFRVAQSTAAGVAARMEKKGLIESLPSENDRRVKRVRITASGAETLRRAIETMERGEKQMLSALDEAEQETLIALLRKVHGALRREEDDCPCP